MIVERLHYEAAEVVGSEPINHPELHRALCGRVAAALDAAEQRGAERVAQRMREVAESAPVMRFDNGYPVKAIPIAQLFDALALAEVAPPTAGHAADRLDRAGDALEELLAATARGTLAPPQPSTGRHARGTTT